MHDSQKNSRASSRASYPTAEIIGSGERTDVLLFLPISGIIAADILGKLTITLRLCECAQDRGSYHIVNSLVAGDTAFGQS
jgi:hypothetical protein